MKRGTHIVIGIALFLVYAYCLSRVHPAGIVLLTYGLLGVAIGSVSPDVLEPATSSRHRGTFHSRRALRVTGVLFFLTALGGLVPSGLSALSAAYPASCLLLGYASHLLADSITPAGLPP